MSPPRVLIVLPSASEAAALARECGNSELECAACPPPSAWRELLATETCEAVLADASCGAEELLACARELDEGPAVVLIAGFATLAEETQHQRNGAFETLARPFCADQIRLALERALRARALQRENLRLRRKLGERFSLGGLLSRDPKLARIAQVLESVADTRVHVLITGESGTGKTLLARAIHQRSRRSGAPFVEVNCGALPPTLLESELFGHARGAFTGAVRDHEGLFEAAHGGTLFLDEISSASLELQVKLLRAVQDQVFERVGETRTRQVDVRVIAASNRDLTSEVRAGRFREDLYWRLHVIALELPPLRERPGDVALLADSFLARFAREHGRPVREFSPSALARLVSWPWPGNVRELENCIERAVLLASGERIECEDLGVGPLSPATTSGQAGFEPLAPLRAGRTLKQALEDPERALIAQALELCNGHRQQAAALLGVNRTTLFNKMRKYGMWSQTPERPEGDTRGAPHAPGPHRAAS
jgi:DNA-binding NtrC family response regulator